MGLDRQIPSYMADLIRHADSLRADERSMNSMSVWKAWGYADGRLAHVVFVAVDEDEARDIAPHALDCAHSTAGSTVNLIREILHDVYVLPAGRIVHGDILP